MHVYAMTFSQTYESTAAPHEAFEWDLKLAAQIQKSMLPDTPRLAGWQIAYFFKPASAVSGDLVDIYRFGDQFFGEEASDPNAAVLLADATGHGVSAALVTMIARQIFFRAHRDHRDEGPVSAMFNGNVELLRDLGQTSLYLTCIYIQLLAKGIRYVNGSHPQLLLFPAGQQKSYSLPNDSFLFGVEDFPANLREYSVPCQRGDVILAYTDGLSEACRPNEEQRLEFGLRRMAHAVRLQRARWPKGEIPENAGSLIKDAIVDSVTNHCENLNALADDITFVVLVKT